ncbi:LOW QUALITY PROTEIN: putative receptor-like protein kinase At4g00960 [Prunus persica]|uniref:LOW QUALITY PROTEIN: putative receptor-like protein kinase At4g00960 n=1 Tax=Prunus persica TaxID=3760 RepID=UPI0009AB8DF0|nr:LOW QUALITY PROTEIN: putative receptor-like protein kinase At4g00960 [Prunus persica]
MFSFRFLFFLSPVLFLMISTQSQSPYCYNDKGNYTTKSTYQTNLNTLLSSLSSPSNNGNGYGFYNSSYGENPDQVYAIGLCRGDVTVDNCRGCLSNATQQLTQGCPNQKEAFGVIEQCTLRYSNRSIYGAMETFPALMWYNPQNVTSDVDGFFQELKTLLEDLRGQAAGNGSLRKFAAATATAPNFQTIHGLAQCTPDLTEQVCSDCLGSSLADIPKYFQGMQGALISKPSCNVRYETYRFVDPTTIRPLPSSPPPLSSPPSLSTSTGGSKSNRSQTVIIIIVPIVVYVIFFCICLRVRRTKKKLETGKLIQGSDDTEEIGTAESLQFDLANIRVSTDDFSEANKLGQGGFGSVYRGRLSNGKDIAVKRLSTNSGQGDFEFKNEVLLVAKLQHRNLVTLLGFCLEGNERLLIYEYVPNASLDHIIFDPTKRAQLDWVRRYKIIVGTARGLLYLHEDSRLKIIHRDLKASNILIDAEMNPKISDFGMARLFVPDQTQGNTSRIVGTFGYMAPEYAMRGHFSVKSDVYSFGVLVLEIVSGQKNSGFQHGENAEDLLSFAWRSWREGTSSNLIDPTLKTGSRNEIMRCIHIGLLCVQENVADRPTMASVILMMNSYSFTLPVPSQPAFYLHSIGSDMSLGSEYNSGATRSDRSKSNSVMVMEYDTFTEPHPR